MSAATRGSWGPDRDTSLADVAMMLVEVPTGISLIVKWPTRCAYRNQTGGHTCQQSWAEGLLVPFNAAWDTELKLAALFDEKSKYLGWCSDGIDENDADKIDALLAEHHYCFHGERVVTVDRARLGDSWEAWVHVRIGPHPQRHPRLPLSLGGPAPRGSPQNDFFWPFFGLLGSEAILTWGNSD
jgi:hypothetical protein